MVRTLLFAFAAVIFVLLAFEVISPADALDWAFGASAAVAAGLLVSGAPFEGKVP